MDKMTFASATLLLILTTDPLGNIPLFLAELKKVRPERRMKVIAREVAIATGVLLGFLVFGRALLGMLHLSEQALQVAGGMILLLIAIRMIFPDHGVRLGDHEEEEREPFIVPLAIPLIGGPSAMATVMLLATRYPHQMMEWVGVVLIAMAVTAVVFSGSTRIQKILGDQAITAIERLMGLVLSAMAADMLLRGATAYLRGTV